MRRVWLSGALVAVALGCGSKKSDPNKEPQPTPETVAAAARDAAAVAPATAAKLPEVAPLAAIERELPPDCHEFDFLGWTADGMSFALQRRYVRDFDGKPGNDDEVRLELREVYDALTGLLTHRFRVRQSHADADETDIARALWKSAEPEAAWKAFSAKHPLVTAKPTVSPAGWTLSIARTDGEAKRAPLSLDRRERGFYFKGDFVAANGKPAVEVRGKHGDDQVVLLRYRWDPGWVYGNARGPIRGNLRPYWSPAGDRVVWAAFSSGLPETTTSTEQRANVVLGALGRQIVIADHGAGIDRARAVAVLLGSKSLPVARVVLRGHEVKSAPGSRVLYAGDAAKAAADAVAAALPAPAKVEAMPADHPLRAEAEIVVELGGTDPVVPAKPVESSQVNLLGDTIGPSGRTIGRLCRWYASCRMMKASPTFEEPEDDKLDPAMLHACASKMLAHKPADREAIADCANACEEFEGIPDCIDGFGKPGFPACEGVTDDDEDAADDEE